MKRWTPKRLGILLTCLFVQGCYETLVMPGQKAYQAMNMVDLPKGVRVNAAFGNLFLSQTDLSIDTAAVGTFDITRVYNSANDEWRFNLDTPNAQGLFFDPSGSEFVIGDIANNSQIPGSKWVKIDDDEVKTLSGLVYDFDASGQLEAMYWQGQGDKRKLVFTDKKIRQEVPGLVNEDVFTVSRDSDGRIKKISGARSGDGRQATYEWTDGRLTRAKNALCVEKGLRGTRYSYDTNSMVVTNAHDEKYTVTFGGADARSVQRVEYQSGFASQKYELTYAGDPTFDAYSTTIKNPLGDWTTYHYDGRGRMNKIEHPLGYEESFVWATEDNLRLKEHVSVDGTLTQYYWPDVNQLWVIHPAKTTLYRFMDLAQSGLSPALIDHGVAQFDPARGAMKSPEAGGVFSDSD